MKQENHCVHCTFDTFVESGAVELISASHVILFKLSLQLYFLSFLCCFKVFDIVYITEALYIQTSRCVNLTSWHPSFP